MTSFAEWVVNEQGGIADAITSNIKRRGGTVRLGTLCSGIGTGEICGAVLINALNQRTGPSGPGGPSEPPCKVEFGLMCELDDDK